jgi:hypothetical protein
MGMPRVRRLSHLRDVFRRTPVELPKTMKVRLIINVLTSHKIYYDKDKYETAQTLRIGPRIDDADSRVLEVRDISGRDRCARYSRNRGDLRIKL